MRGNNRDMSGINGDFLCIKGRFGFDFTKHPERIKQPMVRQGDKLVPVSWEEAAQTAATKLKEVHAKNGGDSIGFIGSNRTSNEENFLFQRLARETFGSSNIDHHRTADYTGLMNALGEHAKDSLLTMDELYKSKAVLLIGNDPTNQNPLVAWQIRAGIRHHGLKLFVINSKAIKLSRKATEFVQVPEGQEAAAVRWLHNEAPLGPELVEKLTQLKAGLDAQSDVAIVFGSELAGTTLRDLAGFGSKLQGKVRYMALGDYANSRGAADMGVLPDYGPGYTHLNKAGMTAPQMVEAAQKGQLKALYVMGANPLAHYGTLGYGRGKAEVVIVHELFMTETAKQADVIFPAASAYEKNGTVTNTSGEVQRLQKAAEVMGPRTDFDLLRIMSHQLEKQGLGKAFHFKNPAAVFEEIRKSVPGYNLELSVLLAGEAEEANVPSRRNGAPYDVPVGLIKSANDTLFTSGTLTKFLHTIESVPEAQAKS
jgi:NADH-quinone oxidoreductase subunit G